MLFNSYPFIVLLIISFALYYIPVFRKYQIQVLIIASSVFYAYTYPVLLILLYFSVIVNIITSYKVVYGDQNLQKTYATLGVITNLGVLAFFKYSPLFAVTFFNASSGIGNFLILIPLPIGISFYTFQGISLMVDTFNNTNNIAKLLIDRDFLKHARQTFLYISFFPQLVAGPIVKAHDFLPQIKEKQFKKIDWEYCFKHIVLGYFLKMVVADNLKEFTFWIEYPYFLGYKPIDLITMLFGFSFQIYSDFAGYSAIAIGIAGLFGYLLPVNFNFPYVATTFRDFWKRWHISLSSFLMEYLYFPLGGNKKGKTKTYINLMIVMLLGGLWHGAAWSYMVWGGMHGIFLVTERFISRKTNINLQKVNNVFYTVFVFFMVTLTWLLFKLPDFADVISYVNHMFSNLSFDFDNHLVIHIFFYSLPVIIYHLLYKIKPFFNVTFYAKIKFIPYSIMIFLILTNSGTSGAFIYFQF
jgi:alginate O-acetyltransferase complex protein AlgI